jgi:hypothetical protein
MEFKYTLNETEYLLASKIAVKKPKRPWARVLSYAYPTCLLLIVWGSFLLGMILERSDLVGITARDLGEGHPAQGIIPAPLLSASIVPACGLFCLFMIVLRILLRLPNRKLRQDHFRNDPGCQAETTVTATREFIAFRSATGSSDSTWGCYSTWAERGGILILVTRAGVRKILKTADLSEAQRAELHSILATALPQK